MSDQWLCLIDGQKLGPLTFTRLQQLAESGRLKADDYVRPSADEQWLVAKNIPNLIPAPAVTPDRESAPAKRRNSGPLPVAQAIIEPGSSSSGSGIPRGKVVASPPPVVAEPPPPGGLPFVIADAKASPDEHAAVPLRSRKKSSNVMPLLIGGVAVVGVLALLLVLVLSGTIDLSGGATSVANADTEKQAAIPKADPELTGEDDEESNPTDANAETSVSAKKSAPRKNANPALATVRQFRDISNLQNIKLASAKIAISGLWLSASEQGEPYAAVAGSAANKDATFLVVKVKIDNAAGAAPMDYQGWGDEAVLFDEADQAIQPLAPGKSPERIVKQQIDPGSSLTDTLVFHLSTNEFQKLRLVLPHETVGIKGGKSFGLELPRQALGRGFTTELANVAEEPVNAQVAGDGKSPEIIDKTPAAMPPPKPAEVKPKDELDDFLKKLDAKAKERDEMEKKK